MTQKSPAPPNFSVTCTSPGSVIMMPPLAVSHACMVHLSLDRILFNTLAYGPVHRVGTGHIHLMYKGTDLSQGADAIP